ncbi:hypothetical protein B0H11DRAFT_2096362 [Mycena galericulata]|nr:hypothetical protein B0H11DRAFT_2096362 [Mycena galericulata]
MSYIRRRLLLPIFLTASLDFAAVPSFFNRSWILVSPLHYWSRADRKFVNFAYSASPRIRTAASAHNERSLFS